MSISSEHINRDEYLLCEFHVTTKNQLHTHETNYNNITSSNFYDGL